jgi:DNA-binding MarR family transcriptional regulator
VAHHRAVADSDEDFWPPDRPLERNARVVPAVIGAAHRITRRIELTSREHGLDAAETLVLAALLHEPACPSWMLRRRLGLHRSTLSSIIDRLERDGRVFRSRNSVDGRRFEIDLTTTGRMAADIAAFILRDVEDEIAGYTSPSERHGAVAVFDASAAVAQRERGRH